MPDIVKPEWTMPELIVLERSTPQETVLCACKTEDTRSYPWYGSTFWYGQCLSLDFTWKACAGPCKEPPAYN